MSDRGPFSIETGRFVIEGASRAGNETYFRIKELGVALDIGRCPDMLIGIPNVFVTHAHLDHALGIPFYAAQRRLRRLPAGSVYLPKETVDDFAELMRLHEKLEDTEYPLHLVGLGEGDVARIRRDLAVRAHRSTHRIVTNAWELLEVRHKLRADLAHLSGEEIARRRRFDMTAVEESFHPILFYTGDTDRRILERSEAIFRAEILMIECSFTADGDQQRAERYAHIHIDDIFEFAERFENECVILTHFSLRDRPAAIHERIAKRCPASLRTKLRLALPPPFMRI